MGVLLQCSCSMMRRQVGAHTNSQGTCRCAVAGVENEKIYKKRAAVLLLV
jgi:hypothetical protein